MDKDKHQSSDLMKAFDFTAADLAANQNGQYSEKQKRRLNYRAHSARFSNQSLVLLTLVYGVIILAVSVSLTQSLVFLFFVVAVLIAIPVVSGMIRQLSRPDENPATMDLAIGIPQQAAGVVRLDIQDCLFDLTKSQFLALQNHASNSNQILS